MGNLSSTREKNIIDCSSLLLEKNCSMNEINKTSPYTLCTIQDLYDMTSLKNGINIDLAAELICNFKNVKIVLGTDEKLNNIFVGIYESLKSFGFNVSLCVFEDDFSFEKNDTVFIFGVDTKISFWKNTSNVINILSENNQSYERMPGIKLFHLDCKHFDRLLCVEILLKCICLGILTKVNKS